MVLGQTRRRPAGVVRQRGAGAVAVYVEAEGVDVDPKQAELLEPGAGEPLRRAAAGRREGRRKRDAAVRFDERRLLHGALA